MKKDLDEARGLLMQALGQSAIPDSHFLHRVYWGLMTVEKELSCYTSFDVEVKISYINEAERWRLKLASQPLDTGPRIHMELERYIIQGRKASLELRREPSSVEASRSKSDAIEGIDRTLEELKEKDPTRYDKNEKLARKWQARFVGTSS